jgi:hypothetical protein
LVYSKRALILRAIDEFIKELRLTYEIMFNRSASSRKLGEWLYGCPIKHEDQFGDELKTCIYLRKGELNSYSSNIANYKYFGPRIRHLLHSMEQWRPRSYRELFIPSYTSRLDWAVAMAALFFGIVSLLGLFFTVWQAVVGQRQSTLALQALETAKGGS